MPMMNRPIFVLGAHKSGTSLVRNLLDGHPALFVVPIEAHFFQIVRFWVDYRMRETQPRRLSLKEKIEAFTEHIEHRNLPTGPMSDGNLANMFDVELFMEHMSACEPTNLADLFTHYMSSIYVSLYREHLPTDLRIVEKSVENAEFAVELATMFPDARFVHVLRNPYANLVSLRRRLSQTRYPFLGRALLSLHNSHYNLYRNLRLIKDYKVLKYEDLLREPERTVRSLAGYLGIDFEDTLLQPTSVSRPWSGNSSRGIRYSGISAANLDRWRTEVTHLEIYLITRHFPFVLEDYDYETLVTNLSRFWPVRGEGVITYLLNRTISRYM